MKLNENLRIGMLFYGTISLSIQVILFSFAFFGVVGVILGISFFPIAVFVTAIGSVMFFGDWFPAFNLVILLLSIYLDL